MTVWPLPNPGTKEVPGELSMLLCNVEGIVSKLKDTSFVSFISCYDFICLVETFVDSFTSTLFPSFTSFLSPAKKLSHHGRRSGGVIVLVRNVLVKQIEVDYDNVIILEVSKELDTDANAFVVNTYLNPPNSPLYDTCNYDNGISMVEQCFLSILEKNEDASFILCGDLNARTGSKVPSYFDFASSCFEAVGGNFWLDNNTSNDLSSKRCSRDIQENENGHSLLVLCSSFDLCILNGACDGDTNGQYTYISTVGNSVIDYVIFLALSLLYRKQCKFWKELIPNTCQLYVLCTAKNSKISPKK